MDKVIHIPIEELNLNPFNINWMDGVTKKMLEESIVKNGLVEPFAIVEYKGKLLVLDGNYRLEVIRELLKKGKSVKGIVEGKVPCLPPIKVGSYEELLKISMDFAFARGNISLLRLARLCRRLKNEGWKEEDIAKLIRKDRTYVSKLINLLYKIAEPLQFEYLWEQLGFRKLIEIAKYDRHIQLEAWKELDKRGWNFSYLPTIIKEIEDKERERFTLSSAQKTEVKEEKRKMERPSVHAGEEYFHLPVKPEKSGEKRKVSGVVEDIKRGVLYTQVYVKLEGYDELFKIEPRELNLVSSKLKKGIVLSGEVVRYEDNVPVLAYLKIEEGLKPVEVVVKKVEAKYSPDRIVVSVNGRPYEIITKFVKTPDNIVCPHFYEFKWALGCPFRPPCSWCYLQGTFFKDLTPRFHPREAVKSALEEAFRSLKPIYGQKGIVLNTGELADSLMDEGNRAGEPFSHFIVKAMNELVAKTGKDWFRVLFLTKSSYVDRLVEVLPSKYVIFSVSLNAEPVAKKWERGAPPPSKRIEGAKRVAETGTEVRVRIDPMVPISGWEDEYAKLVDEIMDAFEPGRITLGTLRGLEKTIRMAEDRSWTKYLMEESGWGLKIPFKTRFRMYDYVIKYLAREWNYDRVALCKETPEIWRELGFEPGRPGIWENVKCNCTW